MFNTVKNISGQDLFFRTKTSDGTFKEDTLYANEIVHGVTNSAIASLRFLEKLKLIKIMPEKQKSNWITDGF